MKVLLLSAYHAASHHRWAQGLIDHLPHFEFDLFTQPPRHFSWRSRGNSLTWAFDKDLRSTDADVCLATSMVDLAGLRGMVPHLATIPTAVYFHENQFAYPTRDRRPTKDKRANADLLLTDLYTALAAHRVLFNSPYNRRSFLEKAQEFLDQMPDQVPQGVVDSLADRSEVLPVPLEDILFDSTGGDDGDHRPLRILWNHRWEYDKAPDRFFEALFALEARFDFRLVVVGQQFRKAPPIFEEARRRLSDRIDHWGWVESKEDYHKLLRESDIVVSTALHEFQGLAVLEAVALGALPVLPNRLAYPDFFDLCCLYPSHPESPALDTAALADHLAVLLADPESTRRRERPDLSRLRWSVLADRYEEELGALQDEEHGFGS